MYECTCVYVLLKESIKLLLKLVITFPIEFLNNNLHQKRVARD